jgi:hypothetical protein
MDMALLSNNRDRVLERADAGNRDPYDVARFERERVGGDDAGAGQEDGPVGERL